ncbi:lytic polysaccharide monooxygenase [Catellatospora bangladeshensis]|uniref:Cellulose-binding protein n=1 Tax=Catellatospora bangladeshensis TaxID=310355 RepID=A0A8J3NM63_9ACTN|nr:lytic polysaccharide monooxygenase [Catellatospora bangladeshensis]GIF83315.1 cellulose-binding protein [Catellatospora bangladeshensis]
MRRLVAYPLAALGFVAASLTFASPASAHGYVSSPPSRQALCASGRVSDCGPIQYEPQSVEGPKGQRNCHGGLSQFAVLNDDGRNWPATSVGTSVTFNWVLTARHSTSSWEYWIGDRRVAFFEDGGKQPNATVSHQVSLAGFSGRQKLLAIWNIGDTPMAFYNCVDLQIGGGGGNPAPSPSPSARPTPRPSASPSVRPSARPSATPTAVPPRPTPPSAPAGEWAPGTTYRTGDEVTYQGVRYRCRQAHTSIVTWEPSYYTLALWLPI